ncbi:MAG: hypothetical protein LBT20_02040 [Clostridiales bacterium]|jgi:hypothetical protein|nr:hypothetical protein [Clostridiales bacterium]
MKKKLLLFLTAVILIFSLSSCVEATIEYGEYHFSDGSIYQLITVTFDPATIPNDGTAYGSYDAESLTGFIKEALELLDFEVIKEENTDGGENADGTKAMGETVERVEINGLRYFESLTEYYIYFGITGDEKYEKSTAEKDEDKSNALFNYYKTKRRTVFAEIDERAQYFAEEFAKKGGDAFSYPNIYDQIASDIKDIDFRAFSYVYRYETYLDSIDMDADEKGIDTETGLNTFIYRIDYDTRDREIEITRRSANYIVWVTVAAGASVVAIAVALTFGKKKEVR